jgi:hypothetical protein
MSQKDLEFNFESSVAKETVNWYTKERERDTI